MSFRETLADKARLAWLYIRGAVKWLLLAALIGVLSGLLGSAFHIGVDEVTKLRLAHPWLLLTLPAAGLLIAALYKITRTEGIGTDAVIEEVNADKGLKLGLIPAIFLSTVLTHMAGGSAGREGAALQLGGSIGYETGKVLRLDKTDLRTATMAGMAAFFSALFGTPLTAAVFAMSVVSVGMIHNAAMLPSLAAALTAFGVSTLLGVEPTRFAVEAPGLSLDMFPRVAALGVLCALVSVLFCETIHLFEHAAKRFLKNKWLRPVIGGAAIIALTALAGSQAYNGAGMDVITRAVEEGQAAPCAFLLKLLFTAVTLACGFKGGEVVPSFFVGATFACAVGPLLGIPAGFAAAVGLVSVFCGATNCPLSSVILAIELFGAEGLLYFAAACTLSFVLSGYSGLYSSQRIVFDKLKENTIDAHANAYREDGRDLAGKKED